MMILEIEGQRVEVDDAFGSMTPEQQASEVDEIARQMAIQPQQQLMQQDQGKQDNLNAAPETFASTAEDVARSAGAGLRQGVETIAGLPGDLNSLIGSGARFVAQSLPGAPELTPEREERLAQVGPLASAPTSQDIRDVTEPVIGAPHEPQTTSGEFARTIGEFAPAAVAGPGGVARKAALAVVPAVASEGAGQATEGTALEPIARFGGAVAGGGLAAGIRGAGTRQVARNAPNAEALKDATDTMFERLRASGITYDANTYGQMVSGLQTQMVKQGFRNANAPKAHALAEELMQEASLGRTPDFSDIQALRQVAGNMVRSLDSSEKQAAMLIRDAIDDFERLAPLSNPGNMTRGQFNKLRARARGLSLRTIKQRALNDIAENAETFQGGVESGIRNGVGKLLRSEKGKNLFKGAERKALLQVSQGTPTRNAIRTLGKFGFDIGKFNGNAAFIPTVSGGAAVAAGEPLTGGALVAAGTLAKAASPRLTQRAFDQAQKVVRSGKAGKAKSSQRIQQLDADVAIRRLISGGNAALLPSVQN